MYVGTSCTKGVSSRFSGVNDKFGLKRKYSDDPRALLDSRKVELV